MMGNPSTRRTERITKHSDESNWRSRKWEKPIQEVESPSPAPKTEMSIKLENDDEQNQRSRLKEIIKQRIESQLIAQPTKKTIEEIAQDDEDERNLRNRLKKGIILRTEPLSIAHTPFIEEMETDEESETEEDYKRRREFIHAYLTMDNEDEQINHKETETDKRIVETPEEQKERLIQAYLTSTMEEEETTEEQNERRKLIHAYLKHTMDDKDEQTEQDKTEMYLRTSAEEEQKPSTWEEYDEEEPLEEYEEDKSFKNDDEGKWTTQFSYPTEEEENALFIAFMTGNVEDQQKWIDAKKNLARATTNEETRKREKEILDRMIPTEIMDLDEPFEEEDEEEMDDLSECRTYNHDMNQEEDSADYQIYPASLPGQEKSDEFIDENTEEEDIQSLESLNTSYRDYRRQDEETVHPLLSELDEQLIGAKYFTEQDVCWGYDNEQIKDEDKWEMAKTNRILFEPMVIFSSSYYSPTTSQTNMDGIFLDQRNERRIDIDNDPETKEQNTEYTRSVQRRSRDNDLSTEPEGYTSWVTRTEYEGLPNPENQLLANPMKLYGIDKWPTPAMTTEVKSFLGFGNSDKGLIQDDWTLTEPFEVLLEMDETFLAKKDEQDDKDMIMLPGGLLPNSLDYGFDDERTLEIDNGQSDPIKSLSVHGLKTLPVNVTNTNLQKWIMMARDMDITVNNTTNILSGKKPNIRKDILED